MAKLVLGVGHCGFDAPRIARVVESLGGSFQNVATAAQALDALRASACCLVLPNRVIAGDEQGGLGVIRAIKADSVLQNTPVMLVSAIAEAQQAAQDAGADRGFGKDLLETEQAAEIFAPYVAEA